MKERAGLGATVRAMIRSFRALNKWKKWIKCYGLMSTLLFAVGLGLTILFLVDDYANSRQAYEGIEIDPEDEAVIWLNFTKLEQMKVHIPVEIENLDKFDSIRDIQAEMALKVEYFDSKSDSEERITIFSTEKDDVKNALPGETTKFSLSAEDGRDEDWDWDNIYTFQTEANPNRKISVLLDLTVSLTSGYDKIWLIYEGIDLSTETVAQVPVESSTNKEAKTEKKGSNGEVQAYKAGFSSKNLLLIVLYSGLTLCLFGFGSRRSKKQPKGTVSKLKSRSQKLRKIEVLKALVKAVSFTAFFIVWDVIILVQLQDESLQEVATRDYVNNYQTSLIASIVLSVIVAILAILPIFFSRAFKSYSISRAALSLVIKCLVLSQTLIYMVLTAYTTFEFKHATLIIDARASYLWFFILIFVQIGLTIVYALVLRFKKAEFESLRSEQKIKISKRKKQIKQLLKTKEELNYLIFKAIEELGEEATFNNVERYFKREKKQSRARLGEQLSKPYLSSLVKKGLLLIEARDNQNIYYLTEHAEEFVKEFENKSPKETEREEKEREKEKEKEKEKLESESLKELKESLAPTEIKDEFGRIDRDLMTARSNPEYQKLGYCSKCKMTNPVKKGKCAVCGGEIK